MPAHHHINSKDKLIVTTWVGDAVDIEFIEAIKKYQKDIQNQPVCINYNEVVDFSNVTGIKFTTKGIRRIGEIASTTDRHNVNRKLAFIVSSKLAYGLVRMYQVYRSFLKNSNKEIRVFKKESDALEWIQK